MLVALAVLFGAIGIVSFFIIIFNETYSFPHSTIIDAALASNFGDFIGGFVGTIFSIMSILLLIYTILHQNREARKSSLETNFFRMIDYHNQNVNQLTVPNLDVTKSDHSAGRRAFVQFKIQIHKLFPIVRKINSVHNLQLNDDQIADIVYVVFYYGIKGSWVSFIEEKLKMYFPNNGLLAREIQAEINLNPPLDLGRTNQTFLSTYFRNMYNAIKLVDNSSFLRKKEKEEIIKIYRAQLSNPELYVIFFNIISRFGTKWKQNQYITKYNFINNMPLNYCEDYNPKDYFQISYEDDEF